MKKLLLMAALSTCVATSGIAQVASNGTSRMAQGIVTQPNQSTTLRAAMTVVEPAEEYAGGTGTEADPYQISTAAHLAKLILDSATPTNQETAQVCAGIYYQQTADIDLSGKYFNAGIGGSAYFAGVYDGNGYAIKNYTVSSGTANREGYNISSALFSNVWGATIKNVTMEDYEISLSFNNCSGCNFNIAALAASVNASIVENCHASGTIMTNIQGSANNVHVGAIIGSAFVGTTINNCSAEGTMMHEQEYTQHDDYASFTYAGGIVGHAYEGVTIVNCMNDADITSTGAGSSDKGVALYTGGIVAEGLAASILNCSNEGAIDATATNAAGDYTWVRVGGIVATMEEGTIDNCWNAGDMSAEGYRERQEPASIVCVRNNTTMGTNYINNEIAFGSYTDKETDLTTEYMQSEAFVADLNGNLPEEGMEWNYQEGDYPTLREAGSTVANEVIAAPSTTTLRTVDGGIMVTTKEPAAVEAYTFYGVQKLSKSVPAGQTTLDLAPGLYIIKVNQDVHKVRVH